MLTYLNKTNAEYELNNEDSLDVSIPEAMKEFYYSVKDVYYLGPCCWNRN